MNRLRTVIRCEEKAEERAYLALGRYYYHNLRDAENTVTDRTASTLKPPRSASMPLWRSWKP